jgi:hypothetical protein
LPRSLNPKVFWLILGTNDLALGMCSEEVVTLGIMRVAEELHHLYPDSIVVIQGILPRSNHPDGTLEGKITKYAERPGITHGDNGGDNNKNKNKMGGKMPRKFFNGKNKVDPEKGVEPETNPNGGRRSLLQDSHNNHQHHVDDKDRASYYNPMDQFLDNYLDHYDDPAFTSQLMNDYWGPPMTENRDLFYNDDDGHKDSTARRRLQDLTTRTAGAIANEDKDDEEEGAQKTSGGSVISTPQKPLTYDDSGKLLPKEMKAPLPKFEFYLWPSIRAINTELEGFCAKHEHFVYFDVDELVLGSIGNQHYRAGPKQIIKELMPNYVHLSFMGHKVLLDVLSEELKRIIYDDDEENDVEKKKGGRSRH